MNNPSVVKMLRLILGAVCALILMALGVQAYSLKSTQQVAEQAVALRQKIAPEAAAAVQAPNINDEYSKLAKGALFYPEQKKEFPPPKLDGLLGGYALIDGRLHSAGDDVNGWKIASISENDIKVQREDEGQKIEQTVRLFEARDNLEIDNRPKNQQRPPDVKGFAGPDSADMRSRLAEWRDRMGSRGESGGASGGGGLMEYASRFGRGTALGAYASQYASQVSHMSDQELEDSVKQRFGGSLPEGVNADTIREYMRRLSDAGGSPTPSAAREDSGSPSGGADHGKSSGKKSDAGHKSKGKR